MRENELNKYTKFTLYSALSNAKSLGYSYASYRGFCVSLDGLLHQMNSDVRWNIFEWLDWIVMPKWSVILNNDDERTCSFVFRLWKSREEWEAKSTQ